jgi:hypothetical protein
MPLKEAIRIIIQVLDAFEMIVPELPLPKDESTLSLLKQKLINKDGIFQKTL